MTTPNSVSYASSTATSSAAAAAASAAAIFNDRLRTVLQHPARSCTIAVALARRFDNVLQEDASRTLLNLSDVDPTGEQCPLLFDLFGMCYAFMGKRDHPVQSEIQPCIAQMQKLVLEELHKFDITLRDTTGDHALHRFLQYFSVERNDSWPYRVTEKLLQLCQTAEHDLSEPDSLGNPPLFTVIGYFARAGCRFDGIRLLLQYGADVNVRCPPDGGGGGGTLLHKCVQIAARTSVHSSCLSTFQKLYEAELLHSCDMSMLMTYDPRSPDDLMTALQLAVASKGVPRPMLAILTELEDRWRRLHLEALSVRLIPDLAQFVLLYLIPSAAV